MKRQCSDPNTYPNTTTTTTTVSAADIFTDNLQIFQPDLPQNSSILQLADTPFIPDPTRIPPDPKPNNHIDGASIETPRRPRGRPIGSKNKPKSLNPNPTRSSTQPEPNNPINQPNLNNNCQILEIPNGADVIQSIAKHAILHNTSLRIVHTSGSVTDVTVRQSGHLHQQTVKFGGLYNVVSLFAVFIIPTSVTQSEQQNVIKAFSDVAIMMSVGKGEIGGGIVVGPLIAYGSVFVLVEPMLNLTYLRLEDVSEINVNTTSSGGGHQPPSGDMVFNGGMYSSAGFMSF